MPGFTLRLSDEQHSTLTEDARRNNRSLQGEVIHRLFPPPDSLPSLYQGDRSLYAQPREAKPDPKPTTEKKGRR